MDEKRFREAVSFTEYLETVKDNRDLWHALAHRATVDEELVARARAIPGRWHVLALTEDWCGDAINTLPLFDRLAGELEDVEMRVALRDDNDDIMDEHLTGGVSRAIPVVIVYDEEFKERAWWGPRPAPMQEWVMSKGSRLSTADRYRELRRFYARDKGRTTLDEFLTLLENAAH